MNDPDSHSFPDTLIPSSLFPPRESHAKWALLQSQLLPIPRQLSGVGIDLTPEMDALQAADQIMGTGFVILNAQLIGTPLSNFNFSFPEIDVGEGVGFTTGFAEQVEGPNQNVFTNGQLGQPGDGDLAELVGEVTYDASGLEFDFIPKGNIDSFELEFLFASEEYCEYLFSDYDDLAAIFLSGPGIDPNVPLNLAVLPDDTTLLQVSKINPDINASFFINNTSFCGSDPELPNEVEFDGLSTWITRSVPLLQDSTYHLKIVVADVLDDRGDSGLLFRTANIFKDSLWVEVYAKYDSMPYAYDACDQEACLVFHKVGGTFSDDLELLVSTGTSTATEGLDFTGLPDTVVIPADQQSWAVPFTILGDALQEGEEWIYFDISGNIPGVPMLQDTFEIRDATPLEVSLEADTFIACEPITINASGLGGVPWPDGSYQYVWDGDTTDQYLVTSFDTTAISLQVIDFCGQTLDTQVVVIIPPPLELTLLKEGDSLCVEDSSSALSVFVDGGFTPYTYAWSNGSAGFQSLGNPPGVYQVTVTDAIGCTGVGEIEVFALPPEEISVTPDSLEICVGDIVEFQATPGLSDYTWFVECPGSSGGLPCGSNCVLALICVEDGFLQVEAIDSNGCLAVTPPVPIGVHFPPDPIGVQGKTQVMAGDKEIYSVINPEPGVTYTWTVFLNGLGFSLPSGAQGGASIEIPWNEPGIATVYAEARNAFGCVTDAKGLVVTVTGNAGAAFAPANSSRLIPHPLRYESRLHLSEEYPRTRGEISLSLWDISGRLLWQRAESLAGDSIIIPRNGLSSGIYFLEILSPEGKEVLKLLID